MSHGNLRSPVRFGLVLLLVLAVMVIPAMAGTDNSSVPYATVTDAEPVLVGTASAPAVDQAAIQQKMLDMPLAFTQNNGQVADDVKYTMQAVGHSIAFTPDKIIFIIAGKDNATACSQLGLVFPGANTNPSITGSEEQPGKVNYLIGSNESTWHTSVPTYSVIQYTSLYPGIDLKYRATSGNLKGEFIVAPGADPDNIVMEYSGIDALEITGDGAINLTTSAGVLTDQAPVAYQEIDGTRVPVTVHYRLLGGNKVGFELGNYDPGYPLVIDPWVKFGTYWAGWIWDVTLDSANNIYVTGYVTDFYFHTVNPYQASPMSEYDLFITKLSPDGKTILYSTYLGGTGNDFGYGIAADPSGYIYVAGKTLSSDFPLKNATKTTIGGTTDAFVAKLNSAGNALVYSTYLGTSTNNDMARRIAADASGNAYVAGLTAGTGFLPLVNASQSTRAGSYDAFVTGFDPLGNVTYSTYLGGTKSETGYYGGDSNYGTIIYIGIDSAGNAYIAGTTLSTDYPTTAGACQTSNAGNAKGFVAKYDPVGTKLAATYLGGTTTGKDYVSALDVDSTGTVWLGGTAGSADFPTTPGAMTGTPESDITQYGFVTKMNASLQSLDYSTLYRGNNDYGPKGIARDSADNVYVTGPDRTVGNYVDKLKSDGSAVLWSDVLYGADIPMNIKTDRMGNITIAGASSGVGALTTTPDAYYSGGRSGTQGFISIISETPYVDFTASNTSGAAPLVVTFRNSTVDPADSWYWDFGDGSTATGENPTHTYRILGNYSVNLTATNAFGSHSVNKSDYIQVRLLAPPFANFTVNDTYVKAGTPVQFNDTSENNPVAWNWSFGDGSYSDKQNPVYTYTTLGTFSVALNVSNTDGYNLSTRQNLITVTDTDSSPLSDYRNMNIYVANDEGVKYNVSDGVVVSTFTYKYVPNTYYVMFRSDGGGLNPMHISSASNAWSGADITKTTNQSGSFWVTFNGGQPSMPNAILMLAVNGSIPDDFKVHIRSSGQEFDVGSPSTSNQGLPAASTFLEGDTAVNQTFEKSDFIYGPQSWKPSSSSGYPIYGGEDQTDLSNRFRIMFIDLRVGALQNASLPDNGMIKVDYEFTNLTSTAIFNSYGWYMQCNHGTGIIMTNDVTLSGYTVLPPAAPVAAFSANTTTTFTSSPVLFTDASTNNPTSWLWNFGDGGTSIEQNPTHTYASAGIYTVTLTVTNSKGTDTATMTNYVTVIASVMAPVVSFTRTPTTGIAPLAVTFNDASSNMPTSWAWDFNNDGTIDATTQNATYTYSTAGTYTVNLTATNSAGSNTSSQAGYVTVTSPVVSAPVASFTGTPTTGTAPLAVTFTDTSLNTPTAWLWDFGDGQTSTDASPSHTYATAGIYTVNLTATNTGGSNSTVMKNHVTVTGVMPGYTGIFVSAANDEGIRWDYHQNNTLYVNQNGGGVNAVHIAVDPADAVGTVTESRNTSGTFWVTDSGGRGYQDEVVLLLAVNGTIPDDFAVRIKTSGYTWIPNATTTGTAPPVGAYTYQPVALNQNFSKSDFVYGPQSWRPQGNPSAYPVFMNESMSDPVNQFQLAFIDTRAGVLGSHNANYATLTDHGSVRVDYTFTNLSNNYAAFNLYAWNINPKANSEGMGWTNGGLITDSYHSGYSVNGIPAATTPVASFTGAPTSGTAPLAVMFNDTSSNSPTSWYWDFGDSTNATTQNVTHTFMTAGNYTVNLTATNSAGSNTTRSTNYVTVSAAVALPVAAFSANATAGTAPLAVQFTDASTGTPTAWSWDFGDGSTSAAQSPVHTYMSGGTFTVNLTATNSDGSTSEVKTGYITVTSNGLSNQFVNPGFETGDMTGWTPSILSGTTPASVSTTQKHSGTYSLYFNKQTAVSQYVDLTGISAISFWAYKTGPSGTPKIWFYIDDSYTQQSFTTSNSWAKYTFPTTGYSGIHKIQIYHYTNNRPYYAYMDDITTIRPLVASFTAIPDNGNTPLTVQFNDTSAYDPNSWGWDFGDGSSSTTQNATHTYYSAGTYTVNLSVTGPGGSDSEEKTIAVTSAPNAPVAIFTATPASGTNPLFVQFNDQSTNTPTSWAWDFGDGSTSTVQNPTHTYTSFGNYTVNLIVMNSDGSDGEKKLEYINVYYPAPITDFNASSISGVIPLFVRFYDTSANMPTSWHWDFGDGSSSTVQNPTHTYMTVGTYTVNLTTTNVQGSDSEEKSGLITVTGGSGGPANSSWPKFGGNVKNTGLSLYNGTQSNVTKWVHNFGQNLYGDPVIGSDGTIYIGDLGNNITALNPDGSMKWFYTTGGGIEAGGAIDTSGTIYFGSDDNNLYALNPDGTLKWKYTAGSYTSASPAFSTDGTIYLPSRDNNVYALFPNGTLKWKFAAADQFGASSPAIGTDGTIYVGCFDNNLYALNPDGTLKWKYTVGSRIYGSAVVGTDGTIYVGSYGNGLIALNPDGTLKWSYNAGNLYNSPAIGSDGTIYVGSNDSNVYAINSDGTLKWSCAVGLISWPSPTIGADGTIYVGSFDYNVYAINSDGTLKWKYAADHKIYTSPIIGADGSVYAGAWSGKLYAFHDPVNAPTANFSADVQTGLSPLTVTFTDTSTDSPTLWTWDFGDGDTTNVTVPNPVHTYTSVGAYTVTLTATNNKGTDTETKVNYITITSQVIAPVTNFTANVTSGAFPLVVEFTDTSENAPTSWLWEFGDGITATTQNAVHSYTTAGTYTVNLTATNVGGSNTTVKTGYITVTTPVIPVASFTATTRSGLAPLTAQFKDTSLYTPTSWLWEFGDGSTSTDQNPSHTYTTAGTYMVNLTATNADGSGTNSSASFITVLANQQALANYRFINLYVANDEGVKYDVPNGAAASGGTYTYVPNTYWVMFRQAGGGLNPLHISSSSNAWTAADLTTTTNQSGSFYVTFSGGQPSMPDGILMLAVNGTVPDDFRVHIRSSGQDFDVGTPGTGNQVLPAASTFLDGAVNQTFEKKDFLYGPQSWRPSSSAGYPIYNGEDQADPNNQFQLMFIDLKVGALQNASLPNNGMIKVDYEFTNLSSVAVFNAYGWYMQCNHGTGIIMTNQVDLSGYMVTPPVKTITPIASFTSNIQTGTAPLTVTFTDTSANTPTSWLWDFGDNSTAITQNVTHTYTTAGTYTVNLTATNSAGSNTISQSGYITVSAATLIPVSSFTSDVTSGNAPLTVTFTDTSANIPTSWLWNFGDGSTVTTQNATHTYTTFGTYTVSLNATNTAGSNTTTKTGYISVSENPADRARLILPAAPLYQNTATQLPVQVMNITNGTGISFDLAYDPAVIRVNEITLNQSYASGSNLVINQTDGRIRLALTRTDVINIGSPVPVFILNTTSTGAVGLSTPLTLTNAMWGDGTFNYRTFNTINGSALVYRYRGDLNGNTEVDIGDTAKTAYMVVKKTPDLIPDADFNNNGRIDVGDASKIAWYLVGQVLEL
ncbi:MAG: PKD domain-containing protein [Methanoregula sp.]|jgi:PKD repeat protein